MMERPPENLRGFHDRVTRQVYTVQQMEGMLGAKLYRFSFHSLALEPIYRDTREEFEEEFPDAIGVRT